MPPPAFAGGGNSFFDFIGEKHHFDCKPSQLQDASCQPLLIEYPRYEM